MAFTVAVCAYFLVSAILVGVSAALSLGVDSDGYKYISYLAAPIALVGSSAAVMAYFKQKPRDVAPLACSPKYFLAALLILFGLLFAVNKINDFALYVLKCMGYTPRASASYVPDLGGWHILPALIVIAVLPAVAEEFFFRGVLLSNLRASVGDIPAVFTGGLCFALFHASAEQTAYQFICGCVFTLIALRSGSLLPTAAMHFANNAFVIILYAVGAGDGIVMPQAAEIAVSVVAAISFLGGLALIIFDKKPYKKGEKGGLLYFFLTALAGLLILTAVWIISFFKR